MPNLPNTYKAWLPSAGEILVKVRACGVCLTDVAVQKGELGDNLFPRVPGHEIIGDIVAIGEGVRGFALEQRVGGAWLGGHDNVCRRDGGYAEYVLLRSEAAVLVPKDMDPAEAAPLLFAGLTVSNAIRKMHIEQENLVAIQGIGSLGHIAIHASKRHLALQLGAHEYIDTISEDAFKKLQELGGAALILAITSHGKAVTPLTAAMQPAGKMLLFLPLARWSLTQMILSWGLRRFRADSREMR
ncbi:hypothetical protein ACJZ2D_014308 [Fusarium nematophilum]